MFIESVPGGFERSGGTELLNRDTNEALPRITKVEIGRWESLPAENPPQPPFAKGGARKEAACAFPPLKKGGEGGFSPDHLQPSPSVHSKSTTNV